MDRWDGPRKEAADDEARPFHPVGIERALLLGILAVHCTEQDPIRWLFAVERDMRRIGLWPQLDLEGGVA